MKHINQLVYLLTISSGGEKKSRKKIPTSQRGDISPEMEQDDNGQTFGKIARSED